MDMHHFARRTAAITMTIAAGTLVFTGCSKNNNNSSGSESSSGSASASETSAGTSATNGAAGETKIPTPNGEIAVSGHILSKYTEMGGPAGTLGAPTGATVNGPSGGMCQEFTGGAVCWSDPTGPHVVWGEIRKAWDNDGGVNGKLGYPVSDEKDVAGGKESDFTGGTVSWVNQQISVTTK
ncbi:LGFP repeat-containing protein [Nocardia terpenica]|nr:esterase [Nocardia terpenica]